MQKTKYLIDQPTHAPTFCAKRTHLTTIYQCFTDIVLQNVTRCYKFSVHILRRPPRSAMQLSHSPHVLHHECRFVLVTTLVGPILIDYTIQGACHVPS